MAEQLQQAGILLDILPRKAINQQQDPISASTARQALKDSDWDLLAKLLPKTSLDYFCSLEAQPIIKRYKPLHLSNITKIKTYLIIKIR